MLALSLGCEFSAGGVGGGTDTDTSTGSSSSTSAEPTTAAPTTGDPTTDPTTGESDTSSSGNTTDPSSSTTSGSPSCPPFATWVWVDDLDEEDFQQLERREAEELPPFERQPVNFLRSFTDNEGTARFAFHQPCDDTVFFWALAWDADGETIENADAYRIGVDAEAADVAENGQRWEYGCDSPDRGWFWYRAREDETCDAAFFQPSLTEGPHHLQIANPERAQGANFNFTGIAAIVVTNDPDFDPVSTYDPGDVPDDG